MNSSRRSGNKKRGSKVGRPPGSHQRVKEVVDEILGETITGGELYYLVRWKKDAYIVEDILDQRFENGQTEYLIKWKNYPHTKNTWVPTENVNCQEKLTEFIKSRNPFIADIICKPTNLGNDEDNFSEEEEPVWEPAHKLNCPEEIEEYLKWHELKREADYIVGITEHNDALAYVVQWKDADVTSLLSEKEVKYRYPQQLIEFYEKNMFIAATCKEEETKPIKIEDKKTEIETKNVNVSSRKKPGRPRKNKTLKNEEEEKQLKVEEADNSHDDEESDNSNDDDEDQYVVEKIIDKQIHNGAIEYLLKWKDFGSEENQWLPSCNLSCPELIAEFEKDGVEGFRNHWTVEEILAYVQSDLDETFFELKWKESKTTELVLTEVAKQYYWTEVIKFYESRIKWE